MACEDKQAEVDRQSELLDSAAIAFDRALTALQFRTLEMARAVQELQACLAGQGQPQIGGQQLAVPTKGYLATLFSHARQSIQTALGSVDSAGLPDNSSQSSVGG